MSLHGINVRCGNCDTVFLVEMPPLIPGSVWTIKCPKCRSGKSASWGDREFIGKGQPPWVTDPEPEKWVKLPLAARLYFRKSETYIRSCCATGQFEGVFMTYRNGKDWWIKLPEALPVEQADKSGK